MCISFTSLSTLINKLASCCLEIAGQISRGPHILCYDNINISTSIFVEQRSAAPAKVQSGTFAILYEVRNANPIHMSLAPILHRAQQATPLTFNAHIRPTLDQLCTFQTQFKVHVVKALLDHCKAFNMYEHRSHPLLQHCERRKIPRGHRTKQYALRTSTIDESSITGNIAVINDVYINQLQMTHAQLSELVIPSINDQSTNARIRGAKALRIKDVNPFTRIQNLQLGFGLFHLCMNLIWALLHVHRGSIHQVGSLSYFFALLDRVRLGCEHPDYHTLLATLLQILQGVILNAWKVECEFPNLAAFASSCPSPDKLLDIAARIIRNHATPSASDKFRKQPTVGDSEICEEPYASDHAHHNLKVLTRDLLFVLELVEACSSRDFGRIEDILGSLCMMFRGAGSNNYCTEILHFLYNLKKVWTPEFA